MSANTIVQSPACTDDRKIAFVVDSCCDVPAAYIDEFPVFVIPLMVNYPDKSYLDRIDIQPQDVYNRMPDEIPRTSTPTPAYVQSVFDAIEQQGFTHVICITISSGLSATNSLIHSVSASHPQLIVEIIDTLNIGFGAGITAEYAMDRYREGNSFSKIVKKTRAVVPRTHIYFVTDTLEYLFKGGRINKAVYSLGTMLNLRPVLTCDKEGKYVVAAKPRGRRKSLQKGIDLCRRHIGKKPFRLALANGDARDEAAAASAAMKAEFPQAVQIIDGGDVSPALVVHTGPGLVGFVIQELG